MKKNEKIKNKNNFTEGPVRHGGRPTNKLRVLLRHHFRRRPSKNVEVNNPANHLVRYPITAVEDIHAIAVEKQNSVGGPRRHSPITGR